MMMPGNCLRAVSVTLLSLSLTAAIGGAALAAEVELGPRPYFLIDQMADGPLKEKLQSCAGQAMKPSGFSIGHRGAPLMFPEHTAESYRAAARMGAGVVECDVTFTADKQLVCRHSQKDLHTTTNILATPLAEKCSVPFSPAADGGKAGAECRTSDITLTEFRTLTGKMDAANRQGKTVAEYMAGTAPTRTDLYAASRGTLMTHAESIQLFKTLGVKFTPELKAPAVAMPYDGFSQQDYAQKLVDEYKVAGVSPSDVYLQSFNLDDVKYWIKHEPTFGKQAVYLDGRFRSLNPMDPDTFRPTMAELKGMGVNYIAPPMWMLVTTENGRIVPSAYAKAANAAGLKLITWTLERSGPLNNGGGWYYKSVREVIRGDGDMFVMLDALARDVGVDAIFSDWPATTTYYANCMGLD